MNWLDTAGAAAYTTYSERAVRSAAQLHESMPGSLHGHQRKAPKGKWVFDTDCLDAWVKGEVCTHRANVRQLRATA